MRVDRGGLFQSDTFTSTEFVSIVREMYRSTREFDLDRLKEWHRRGGVMPEKTPGRGRARTYGFDEMVFIAAMFMLSKHVDGLDDLALAAHRFASIVTVEEHGYFLFYADDQTFHRVAEPTFNQANEGAVLVNPLMFWSRMQDVTADLKRSKCA